jgi:hypothetical protein
VKGAVERLDTVRQASQARPTCRIGSPDAVVVDVDDGASISPGDADADRRGVRVLRNVRERLGDEKVRSGLDRLSEAFIWDDERHRNRRTFGERPYGGSEALVREDRRVNAAGELAKLVERTAQLVLGLAEKLAGTVRLSADLGTGELESEPEAEKALLRAVVKVPLEPTSLVVPGLHDAGPRRAQLRKLRA